MKVLLQSLPIPEPLAYLEAAKQPLKTHLSRDPKRIGMKNKEQNFLHPSARAL
jgi:hypothetical protein